ncbi:unnamed protein product, partial [Ectocarpus sp. 12 AP-2014]
AQAWQQQHDSSSRQLPHNKLYPHRNRHQKPTTRRTYTQHSIKTDTEQLNNKIQIYAGIKHEAFDAQLIIPSLDHTNNLSSDHELFSLQNNRHLPERLCSSTPPHPFPGTLPPRKGAST